MAATPKFLTDEQWAKISPLLPSERPGFKGGRPRRSNREVLEGPNDSSKPGTPNADRSGHHAKVSGGLQSFCVIFPPYLMHP